MFGPIELMGLMGLIGLRGLIGPIAPMGPRRGLCGAGMLACLGAAGELPPDSFRSEALSAASLSRVACSLSFKRRR
jgi:hypothetical protein